MMAIMTPFFFFKSIGIFLKMSRYGAVAIYCYFIFILYAFIDNVIAGRIKSSEVNLGTSSIKDISIFIGNVATSYIIHHEITQLVSTNKIKKNNARDTGLSYGMVTFLLGIIGVLGSLGLNGRKPTVATPITIYDYFEGENVFSFIVAFLFFV